MNHGKRSPQVLQEYPVSVVLCKLLYRLVGEFGVTGSAEEEGGKKENTKGKKSCFYRREIKQHWCMPPKNCCTCWLFK